MESSRLSADRAAVRTTVPATLAKPKLIEPGLPPAKAVRITRAVIDLIFAANALAERNLDPGGPSCLECHRFALGLDGDTGGIEHAATCRTGQALAAIAGIGAAAEGDDLDEAEVERVVTQFSQSTHERSTSEETSGERPRGGLSLAGAALVCLSAIAVGCIGNYLIDRYMSMPVADPVPAAQISISRCESVGWESRNCQLAAVALVKWELQEGVLVGPESPVVVYGGDDPAGEFAPGRAGLLLRGGGK